MGALTQLELLHAMGLSHTPGTLSHTIGTSDTQWALSHTIGTPTRLGRSHSHTTGTPTHKMEFSHTMDALTHNQHPAGARRKSAGARRTNKPGRDKTHSQKFVKQRELSIRNVYYYSDSLFVVCV